VTGENLETTPQTVNRARGESVITINGETHRLCLTLGALAEIEAALGGGSLEKLQARLRNPSLADILAILHALLRGGGAGLTLEALKMSDVDLTGAIAAIADAFRVLPDNGEDA